MKATPSVGSEKFDNVWFTPEARLAVAGKSTLATHREHAIVNHVGSQYAGRSLDMKCDLDISLDGGVSKMGSRLKASATTFLTPWMYWTVGPYSSTISLHQLTWSIEKLANEVFVISVHNDFMAQQHCTEFTKGFHYGEKFFLNDCISGLSICKLTGIESQGSLFLTNNSAEVRFWSISVDFKWNGEIRVAKGYLLGQDPFQSFKGFLTISLSIETWRYLRLRFVRGCAELGLLRYHLLVMVDSPKETVYMTYILGQE